MTAAPFDTLPAINPDWMVAAWGDKRQFWQWLNFSKEAPFYVRRCGNAAELIRVLREESTELVLLEAEGTGRDALKLTTLIGEVNASAAIVVVAEQADLDLTAQLLADGADLVLCQQRPLPLWEPALRRLLEQRSRLIGLERTVHTLSSRLRVQEQGMQNATRRWREMQHDLRTPVAVVQGFCANLIEGINDPLAPKPQEQLSRIRAAADHLAQLLDGAKELLPKRTERPSQSLPARAPQRRQLHLTDLCQEAIRLFQAQAEDQGISLLFEHSGQTAPVWGERTRLMQLILNLVANALRFTPRGGNVSLRLRPENSRTSADNNDLRGCRLSVTDTGPGIPPAQQRDIFRRGFTTAEDKGHAGLGLSICRDVAEEHGARLWVESVVGKGTSFHFVIPTDPRTRSASALTVTLLDDPTLVGQLVVEMQQRSDTPLFVEHPSSVEELASQLMSSGGSFALGCLDRDTLARLLEQLKLRA